MTKFEDVIQKTGDLGKFQKRLIVFIMFLVMPVAFNTNLPIVILTVPKHRCALDTYPNDTYAIQSAYHRMLINESIPWENGDHDERSSCTILRPKFQAVRAKRKAGNNNNNNESSGQGDDVMAEVQCDRWVYDREFFDRTIIEELGIVCDQEEWRTHANMAMLVGKLVSAVIQGLVSDIFGRRKSLLGFVLIMIFAMFSNALIYNIPSLMAFRFIAGLATTSTYMNCFVLAVEFLGIRYRQPFNVLIGIAWSVGGFILSGVAYGLRDYEYVSIALGCPTVLALAAFWLFPESPRWLISKGRVDEARKVIQRVADVNGKPFPEEDFTAMVKEEEEEQRRKEREEEEMKRLKKEGKRKKDGPLSALLQHPNLVVRFLLVMLNWISNSMTYYGILFNVQNLSGDIYLNFFLTNCVDLVGNISCYFVVDRFGRKRCFLVFLGLAVLACLASIFPPLYAAKSDTDTILTVLSLAGRLGISTSFNILFLLSAEIYPTTIRNSAMGTSSMASRIGSISAPYIADLGKTTGGKMASALPLMIFGAVAFLSWVGALFLPETNKHKLPDTILEAANFGRKKSKPQTSSKDKSDILGHELTIQSHTEKKGIGPGGS